MTKVTTATLLSLAFFAVPISAYSEQDEAKEHADLARAMSTASIPLERGVSSASAREGTPISAKYEVEDGKLQLSVYTAKKDGYSEVIVDPTTGNVTKSEPITSGDDLKAAQDQKQAMTSAKRSLAAATTDATKKNPGYRAVSTVPRVEGGRPIAAVTLLKGNDWKTVSERLDSK